MLKSVRFAGIKSLLDVQVDLTPLTVLVGPNGCGKSTVLDQMEMLCSFAQSGPLNGNIFGAAGVALTANNPDALDTTGVATPKVWQGDATDGGGYRLSIGPRSPANHWGNRLTAEVRDGGGTTALLPAPNNTLTAYEAVLQNLRWRSQRLALERRMLLTPSPYQAPLNALHPSGHGLATLLLHLAANYPESYGALQQDLKAIVPHFERLHVRQASGQELENTELSQGYMLDLTFRGAGRIPAAMASEGTLFALALLTALHAPEMPRLILMDDIDHGLHLSAQFQMIDAIRRVMAQQADLQVVCTSHAPVLVDSFKPEEVRVMALDKDGRSRIKPLLAHPDYLRWSRALGTGELWANLGENWVCDA